MYQSKMKSEETDHLFKAILSLRTEEECYRFFDDLCTFSEIEAMSQRFEVASLLADGKTFTQISQKIGVSSTTITRVNKCLCYGADGYNCCLTGRRKRSNFPVPFGQSRRDASALFPVSCFTIIPHHHIGSAPCHPDI